LQAFPSSCSNTVIPGLWCPFPKHPSSGARTWFTRAPCSGFKSVGSVVMSDFWLVVCIFPFQLRVPLQLCSSIELTLPPIYSFLCTCHIVWFLFRLVLTKSLSNTSLEPALPPVTCLMEQSLLVLFHLYFFNYRSLKQLE
jgi:hypothetical protein